MGGMLAKPNTEFEIDQGTVPDHHFACVSMQGWRIEMEDAHILNPDFTPNHSLYAVFDGHGGSEVSLFASKMYGNFLKEDEYFKKKDYARALVSSFRKFDLFMMSPEGHKLLMTMSKRNPKADLCAGSTAIVMLVEKEPESVEDVELKIDILPDIDLQKAEEDWEAHKKNIRLEFLKKESEVPIKEKIENKVPMVRKKIWIANSGDCRSLLIRDENVYSINYEHKPGNRIEFNRIKNAGGLLINGRINENLNLSRALGDFHYKSNSRLSFDDQLIISRPDIYEITLNSEKPESILLGCDGVYERMDEIQLAEAVRRPGLKKTKPEISASEEEIDESVVEEMKRLIGNDDDEAEKNEGGEKTEDNDSTKDTIDNQKSEEVTPEKNEKKIDLNASTNKNDLMLDKEGENIENKNENTEQKESEKTDQDAKKVKTEVKKEEKKVKQDVEKEEAPTPEKVEEDRLVENLKFILDKTLARAGQLTGGLGFDNMSAICVKFRPT